MSSFYPPCRSSDPFVCFECRKSFKRARVLESPACPDCGGSTVWLSQKFKAPPKRNVQAWRVVRFLVDRGFWYGSVYELDDEGCRRSVAYPKTMAEAGKFAQRFKSQR
jgi:DNA-directed RNA polymerase subunit RPC12/RpoP